MSRKSKKQQLVLLSAPEDSRIQYYNDVAAGFCGIAGGDLDFFTTRIHPEDQTELRKLRKSLKNGDEKMLDLRIKDGNNHWKKLAFRNRLYSPLIANGSPSLLSMAEDCTPAVVSPKNYRLLEDEYEDLMASLDEAFSVLEIIFDDEGKAIDGLFLETNASFEKQLGLKDVVGKTIRELVEQPSERWLEKMGRVALKGKSLKFQDLSENLKIWLDMFIFRVGGEESRRVVCISRNITHRKLTEEKLQKEIVEQNENLRESNELLQTVFDTTNLAVAVMRAKYCPEGNVEDFTFIRVNKVLREMYLQEEVIGRSYLETSKHGVKMGMFDAFKNVMKTGEAFDQEFFFDKDGYNHWFRVIAKPQNDLLIASIEDITARKAEAEELKENIRFKRELVRTTPEVIMIINLNTFSVRYINKDIIPEVGMTREKVLGMSLQEILPYIHPRDREKIISFHRALLKSSVDEVIDLELRLKLTGTTWEWFNVRGKVFRRRDEHWVDEYVLLVRNITEEKNTQKALLKAEKLSIQGEVARTFAHELRNPLASIGMVNEVLSKKIDVSQNSEVEKYFSILKRSTKTLNDLVTNLLNAANYKPAVLEKADLAEIVNATIEKAADRIYLAGINVVRKYTGPYPILADKEKLEIALLNIIINASEATTPGEGLIEVEIENHRTDYLLSIRDNGHGLEEEQIERLFEAFYSNKESGMGVGLNSVKNILEEHDAKIEVKSQPKEGSTFMIYLHNAQHI